MKTLHAYLLRQTLASLLMTMAVFTFVLLIGNILKEILILLIQRQVTAGIAVQAVGLLLPFVWVFALPMAMLTATLLVFGRFSADQELTAARASGISLLSLVTPIFMLALLLCGFSALVNLEIAPRCRVAYKRLLAKLTVEIATNVKIPEGRFIKEYPGYIIYVEKSLDNHQLQNVIIVTSLTNGTVTAHAPRGEFRVDWTNQVIVLDLFDVKSVTMTDGHGVTLEAAQATTTLPLPAQASLTDKPRISDMTFRELRAELRDLEKRLGAAPLVSRGTTNAAPSPQMQVSRKNQFKDLTTPIRVQIHRGIATSFACFGFTLVGIPLGIRVHRRETNVGFFIALALVMVYYGLISVAQSLDSRAELRPYLIMWLPNFIFQAVGIVLLRRVNRGM